MDTKLKTRRTLWMILILKLTAAIAKLTIGFSTGALALVADGFNSVFDGISTLIGLLGVRIAAQPADSEHPYGHRKAESIATVATAVFLLLTTWELLSDAVGRLLNPSSQAAQITVWSFGAMLLSLAINIGILAYALPLGRRLHSPVLIATGMDTRADVMIAISLLAGLAGMRAGYPILDPLLAILIAVLIGKTGVDILRDSFPPLMDRATLPADEVSRIALSVPGVISCHQVRSRGQEDALYADLHIQVDPNMSTEEAHSIAHEIQDRLRQHATGIQDVTIHVEPTGTPETGVGQHLTAQLREIANELELGVHDIWSYAIESVYFVELHVEARANLSLTQAHSLASDLEHRAHAIVPQLAQLVTHIEPAGESGTSSIMLPLTQSQVQMQAKTLVDGYLGGDTCHSIRLRQRNDNWDLSLHCRLPGDLSLTQAHDVSTKLEMNLRAQIGHLSRIVIHTEPQEDPNGV